MRISDWSSDVCSSDLIGLCREVERLLAFDRHAVHRGDFGGRRGDMRFPALPAQAVQYGRGDERIEFVEAVEGQHRDLHVKTPAKNDGPKGPRLYRSSEERRVGKECVIPGSYRWPPVH